MGTPQAAYYVTAVGGLTLPISWTGLAGSTNAVTNSSGLWNVGRWLFAVRESGLA